MKKVADNSYNSFECFQIVFRYLDKYWQRTKLDDVAGLLGSMDTNIFADNKPADMELFKDWDAITHKRTDITPEECFDYMIEFIKAQNEWLDLGKLIDHLKETRENKGQDWEEWLETGSRAPDVP